MRPIKPVRPRLRAPAQQPWPLPTLAPAGAQAHKHRSPSGRCAININVAPRQITAGDSLVVFGRLRCTGVSRSGQTVRLFESIRRLGRLHARAEHEHRSARLLRARRVAGVQANSVFYVSSHGAASGHSSVRTSPR